MRKITVGLEGAEYPILIDESWSEQFGEKIKQYLPKCDRVMVVTNADIGRHYLAPLQKSLKAADFAVETTELPEGESEKTVATTHLIWDSLIAHGFTRQSALVALGGGVVGDITGFAAACYMRGVDFIQAPTSLLAMVDSSVGGKTGVNHPLAKNIIGAFWQPKAVLMDLSVLQTLPVEEFRSGLAEVIKHGVIRDAEYFDYVEANLDGILELDGNRMSHVVAGSCKIKSAVVAEDEKEHGLRAILNFGHTVGHAIENLVEYGNLRHGECVSIGMIAATRIAEKMELVDTALRPRLAGLLMQCKLPVTIPELEVSAIMEKLKSDKKVRDGKVRFVLPVQMGEVTIRDDVPEATISEVLCEMGASNE